MISAIVLAAGQSERMGRTKQLLPFGGSTILEQVVANILASKVDEVIVVLGHQAGRIAPRLASKPLKIALNRDYAQGMSSSIKCSLNHIAEASDSVMIVLGDQPLIGKDIIDRLVEEFAMGSRGIAVPVHNGKRGHPVIFAAKYRLELLSLQGDTGARRIIEAHPEDVLEVEVGSETITIDINTPDEYRTHAG